LSNQLEQQEAPMAALFVATFRRLVRAFRRDPSAAAPELWCRPATVLALRDPAHAPSCMQGWR
jgi:hypothetical protein